MCHSNLYRPKWLQFYADMTVPGRDAGCPDPFRMAQKPDEINYFLIFSEGKSVIKRSRQRKFS
jgi:hypothetical protein